MGVLRGRHISDGRALTPGHRWLSRAASSWVLAGRLPPVPSLAEAAGRFPRGSSGELPKFPARRGRNSPASSPQHVPPCPHGSPPVAPCLRVSHRAGGPAVLGGLRHDGGLCRHEEGRSHDVGRSAAPRRGPGEALGAPARAQVIQRGRGRVPPVPAPIAPGPAAAVKVCLPSCSPASRVAAVLPARARPLRLRPPTAGSPHHPMLRRPPGDAAALENRGYQGM